MADLPTVRIACPADVAGYAIINLSDYDPAVHVLFDEPAEAPAAPVALEEPAPARPRTSRSKPAARKG